MNPRDMLRRLGELIDSIAQSGEEPPDDVVEMLTETFRSVSQLVRQEAQENAPPPTVPPIRPGQLLPAPSNDARLLWILAGRQPQAFISYLRTFPTPATSQLVSNPNQLNETIVQLQQSMPEGENEPLVEGGVPHAPLQSSNVWGARYDPRTGRMRVRFQGGSIYEYDCIPQAIFDAFIHGNAEAQTDGENRYGRWWRGKNPSLGAALNQYIKQGNFQYRRIR